MLGRHFQNVAKFSSLRRNSSVFHRGVDSIKTRHCYSAITHEALLSNDLTCCNILLKCALTSTTYYIKLLTSFNLFWGGLALLNNVDSWLFVSASLVASLSLLKLTRADPIRSNPVSAVID